jgi:hypothetical protein
MLEVIRANEIGSGKPYTGVSAGRRDTVGAHRDPSSAERASRRGPRRHLEQEERHESGNRVVPGRFQPLAGAFDDQATRSESSSSACVRATPSSGYRRKSTPKGGASWLRSRREPWAKPKQLQSGPGTGLRHPLNAISPHLPRCFSSRCRHGLKADWALGSIRIFAWVSASPRASKASSTPSRPTVPVTSGPGSTLPSASRCRVSRNSIGV